MDNPNPAKPIAEILPKILATLTPTPQRPTTQRPLSEKQQRWLDKWLRLQTNQHTALLQLETTVLDLCRDYRACPRRGGRLVITGPNGCGKTHTARAIHVWASRCAMLMPLDPVTDEFGDTYDLSRSQYLFWPEVVDGFKSLLGFTPDGSAIVGRYEIIERAVTQSMLVIDDIGAEHDPGGIGKEKLFYLLERRAQRWTIMTTNVPPDSWETKFERRIASRLLRNCQIIDLSGVPDYCAS